MTATLLERGSKLVLLLSVLAAGALTVRSVVDWPALPWVSVVALSGSFVVARRFPTVVVPGWLLLTYLAPGLLAVALGGFRPWDLTPWFAGLVGAMAATADPTRWHLPQPWRAPLAAWGVVVALSWPVIWLREVDFAPSAVWAAGVVNNRVGSPPDIVNLWALGVVLTHGLGLLLVDWLCATFPRGRTGRFERMVLAPLGVSCGLSWLVATYQSLVDRSFINAGHWAGMGRASGLLMDANPFGMMAALWGAIGVALVLGPRRPGPLSDTQIGVTGLVLTASWYGIRISGSRSALIAGGLVLLFMLWCVLPGVLATGRGRRVAAGLAVAALVAAALVVTRVEVVGPWARLRAGSRGSLGAMAVEAWNRNGYGAAATRMIADFPLVGVGVGAFHTMGPDVAYELGYGHIEADNAQNWFRHQLAEFGLLGSLGWIVWVATFLWLLARGRPVDGRATQAGLVRGALVALGMISLVGMPTQSISLALTFWTIAFWYWLLVEPGAAGPLPSRLGATAIWAGVWGLALVHLAGLAYVSSTTLRVPFRASAFDWDYSHGFYAPEPDGTGDAFRWAAGRAVAAVPVLDDLIELSAWVHHPDAGDDPVELTVWLDGERVLHGVQESGEPLSRTVPRPPGQQRVVIETWVNRTWSPIDYGEDDTRVIGPGVRWRFLER